MNDKNTFTSNNDENNTEGASRIINNIDENHNDTENHNDENNLRTLIVGPSFCGKTDLLLNNLQLIRFCDSERQIKLRTRSQEQYENTALLAFGIQLEDTAASKAVFHWKKI